MVRWAAVAKWGSVHGVHGAVTRSYWWSEGAVSPVSAARKRGSVWGALLTSGCSPLMTPNAAVTLVVASVVAHVLVVALVLVEVAVVVVTLVRGIVGSGRRFGRFATEVVVEG